MRIVRNGPIRTRKQYLLVVGVAVLLRDYEAAPTQKEKPMATPISIFNPNNLPIDIIVNNGSSQLQVLAAAGPNWTPPTPTTNPTFNYGPPAPGNLGIGSNLIQIMPQGSTSPFVIAINLPGTVNWSSIQIYIFFQTYSSCSWIVLNAGQQISQGTAVSEQALSEMA